MEYNQFEVQEEQTPKEFKKHPIIAIVLFSLSILCVISGLVLTLLNGMEQLYTCLYAASLLTLIVGFNCLMKFKGFCLIFYPILVIYSIISAYTFFENKAILEFQFPIICTSALGIYFVQALYTTIRKKDFKQIILPSICFIPSIVLISLFNIIGQKLLGTIISALIIPIMVYELIVLIIDFKNKKYQPTIEAKANEPVEQVEETKNED